jgi:hypothetical protein
MTPGPQYRIGGTGGAVFDQQEYLELMKARRRVSEFAQPPVERGWVERGCAALKGEIELLKERLDALEERAEDAGVKGFGEDAH